MKAKYLAPNMVVVTIRTHQIIATSTIWDKAYTDDPQDVADALVKEQTTKTIWDDEW